MNTLSRVERCWSLAVLAVGLVATSAAAAPSDRETHVNRSGLDTSPVFLRVQAEREDPYQQERVILRTRVYAGPNLVEGALADPEITGATVERLGDDRPFREEIDGRLYRGIERTYAVYPEAAGVLVVPAIPFQGVVRETAPRPSRGVGPGGPFGPGFASDWFDDFFSSRMPTSELVDRFFNRATRRVTVHSRPLTLKVRPRPEAAAEIWWLPARALALDESWDPQPDTARVGEALTRRISLHGAGVGAALLPPLQLPDLPGAKQYPEAPQDSETVVGASRVQEFTVIPTEPGPLTLPAVEVQWWDTDADMLRTAALEARTIEVLPGLAPAAPGEIARETPAATLPVPEETALRTHHAPAVPPWSTVAIGVLGLAGGMLWYGKRRGRRPAPEFDQRAAERALRRACRRSDPVGAERALRQVAVARARDSRPVDVERWAVDWGGAAFGKALAALSDVRYSNGSREWEGTALWKGYRAASKRARRDRRDSLADTGLAPLYPGAGAEGGTRGTR